MSSLGAMTPSIDRPPLYSIALISGTVIAYEILLMRLFSVTHWHHFAYMILSLALLGFGASGTFLAIAGRWLRERFRFAYTLNAALFGIAAVACFSLAQHIPLNALELLWDTTQYVWLLCVYLLVMMPFFLAANCIGLAFIRFKDRIPSIYAFDLLGAGVGSVSIIMLLFVVFPDTALRILGGLGLLGAAFAWFTEGRRISVAVVLLSLAVLLVLALPKSWTQLVISDYKGLSQALRVAGASVVDTRSSPLGVISVVKNHRIPIRFVPGLSIKAGVEIPEQVAVFTDGDALSVIARYDGRRDSLRYLDHVTSAVPYYLLQTPRVLVLGAGGGADVLQALYHGARQVDAVELNEQFVDLLRNDYANFSGEIYTSDKAHVHINEARGFVAGSDVEYDLIQVALLDSFNASSAGLSALGESHLYTVEAFQEYIRHLRPDGLLTLTRWVKLPPRDGIKLFATAVEALRASGVVDPGSRVAWLRSWNTSTLLIKNGAWTSADSETLRNFCEMRAFDTAYYPRMTQDAANRFNVLDRPFFFEAAVELLSDRNEAFLDRYKFQVTPATDDRPYFFNFFKWSTLSEILSLRDRGGVALLELGYLMLVAVLIIATLASIVLILLPLWVSVPMNRARARGIIRSRVCIYFLAIGTAFLFVEIAFIQKFIVFLSHPLYAVGVVLAGFLTFAGFGSRFSVRSHRGAPLPLSAPIAGIVLLGVCYVFALPVVFGWLMPQPDAIKIIVALVLIAPLGFCMGMPFPKGLVYLGKVGEECIPWAWGINGCASVVSAVLATILAVHFGFTVVVLIALFLYILAWVFRAETFVSNPSPRRS